MHRILGIVAEYNPLHKGHHHQLQTAIRETGSEATIVAMSGNFVQRGEPAILPKWTRAHMALAAGADLVVELPTWFVLQSAEGFARGGISLLTSCGVTDISFGSESGQLTSLKTLARWLDQGETQLGIKEILTSGITYAAAIQRVADTDPDISRLAPMLRGSNNILAIEYLRALQSVDSDINVHTVKRVGPGHGSPVTGLYASATAVRTLLQSDQADKAQGFIPQCSKGVFVDALEKNGPVFSELFAQAIYYALTTSRASLSLLPACSEGLENRVLRALDQQRDIAGLIGRVKTKRYPRTRIQRFLYQSLLQFQTIDYKGPYCPYIRVLGCTTRGKSLLPYITKLNKAPLLFSARDIKGLDRNSRLLLDLDFKAASLYNLVLNPDFAREDARTMPVSY
jgi:predicted nucleotidyltransferase